MRTGAGASARTHTHSERRSQAMTKNDKKERNWREKIAANEKRQKLTKTHFEISSISVVVVASTFIAVAIAKWKFECANQWLCAMLRSFHHASLEANLYSHSIEKLLKYGNRFQIVQKRMKSKKIKREMLGTFFACQENLRANLEGVSQPKKKWIEMICARRTFICQKQKFGAVSCERKAYTAAHRRAR